MADLSWKQKVYSMITKPFWWIKKVYSFYTLPSMVRPAISECDGGYFELVGVNLQDFSPQKIEAIFGYIVKYFPELVSIKFHQTNLSNLPESIGKLVHLKKLHLTDNLLSALPKSIGHLTRLETLNLFKNQLSDLPKEIGNLTRIQTLDLSHNRLTALPEEIGNLIQIQKTLDLSHNQLTALPEEIGNLTQVQTLDFSYNQLTALPKNISNLSKLTKLALYNNDFLPVNDILSLPKSLTLQMTAGQGIFPPVRPLNSLPILSGSTISLPPGRVAPSYRSVKLSDFDNYLKQIVALPVMEPVRNLLPLSAVSKQFYQAIKRKQFVSLKETSSEYQFNDSERNAAITSLPQEILEKVLFEAAGVSSHFSKSISELTLNDIKYYLDKNSKNWQEKANKNYKEACQENLRSR